MASQRVVVFDIESVPDLPIARAALGVDETLSDADARRSVGEHFAKDGQDPGDAFIKTPLHKIVCLSALYAERFDSTGAWSISRSGVAHIGLRSEQKIVEGFIESLAEAPSPQLVGFNSSGFDLPLLRYRAFALEVPASILHRGNGKDYWYRFGRDHIDLCDVMSGFGASTKPSLSELGALCGIPVKRGVTGAQVEPAVLAGRIEDVAAYCETDVLATYLIYLRYCLIVGELNTDAYNRSLENAQEFIRDRIEKRPHLRPYLQEHALPK